MRLTFNRRHSKWYELLIFSSTFHAILGLFLVVFAPFFIFLSLHEMENVFPTLLYNCSSFFVVFYLCYKVQHFPGARSLPVFVAIPCIVWGFFGLIFYIIHSYVVWELIASSYFISIIWNSANYFLSQRFGRLKIAIVPYGRALQLIGNIHINSHVLEKCDLEDRRFDAVVADLHAKELSPEWERFLARCTLAHIPVLHFKQVEEALTGKVRIEHLAENHFGNLLPSGFYLGFKRFYDTLAVILLSPIILPFVIVIGILIKIDSNGPVFFVQNRMGYRGEVFKVFKFRSMIHLSTGRDFTELGEDPRITKFGKFIRKYRIDEIPQLINIVKGDMSFIGPRPESLKLSEWYERDIPFFSYRHVVRPGISGWAQVNQGYAAELTGMTNKLQYDFYYIKHFSIWLDVLIALKTVRTIATGYGAR